MEKAKRFGWLFALPLMLFSSMALAGWDDINMREGVTEISRRVYELHMIIFAVCVVIGIVVFGTMIVSMLMHRKSLGVEPADFHENHKLEILWTIIPIVILVTMAVPATTTLNAMYDSGDPEIDIEVRGYQWKWQYTYINDDPAKEIQFTSNLLTPPEEYNNQAPKREQYLLDVDNPVVIPINTRVRFLVTAEDVIHSFWVPDFAVKKDAIPGFVHEAWTVVEEPGIYRGQCAELCGAYHGFMPIEVHAVEQDEYDAWIEQKIAERQEVYNTVEKEWTMDELMAEGEEVYLRNCATCHQANGQGIPPAFPSLVGQGIAVGPLQGHIDVLLDGVPGSAMQSFRSLLNPAELAAVITYERQAWGNGAMVEKAGHEAMVQPKEINRQIQAGQ